MSKVIVFHYSEEGKLPKLSKNELNNFKDQLNEELKNYPNVKFNGTYVDQDGRGVCDWDAPNTEVVDEIIKKVLGASPTDGMVLVNRVL